MYTRKNIIKTFLFQNRCAFEKMRLNRDWRINSSLSDIAADVGQYETSRLVRQTSGREVDRLDRNKRTNWKSQSVTWNPKRNVGKQ